MKLMILDGNSIVNRAFYGVRTLNAPDGTPMYVLLEHSRFYDSRAMSILIDGVMSECKAQGIDTISPAEIEEIKQKWGIEVAKHNSR